MNINRKFWDMISNIYDKSVLMKYEQVYYKTVENTKNLLNVNDIVLDFACGTGLITNKIANHAKEIHAIDISSKMIDIAKRKANERKLANIDYTQSSIFDDIFKKESFNVILALNILHLLNNKKKIIQRINELLKPGGLFISGTLCLGQNKSFIRYCFLSFLSFLLFLLSKIRLFPFLNCLKFSKLEGFVIEGNFQIIETENIPHSQPYMFIVAKKQPLN